jgi:hypothetical protein
MAWPRSRYCRDSTPTLRKPYYLTWGFVPTWIDTAAYTVAQRRGVNPSMWRSKSTWQAMRPQRSAVNRTTEVVNRQ